MKRFFKTVDKHKEIADSPEASTSSARIENETMSESETIDIIDIDCNNPKRSKFIRSYSKKWEDEPQFSSWIAKNTNSSDDNCIAFCTFCNTSLKIASGKADLVAHSKTAKHISRQNAVKLQPNISESFKSNTKLREKVFKAELQNAALIAEHNLAFNLADHLVKMEKSSFEDSAVVPELKCGRLKVSGLLRNVFGVQQFDNLVKILKASKFSICVDESTDISQKKILSVVVRFRKDFEIQDYLFDLIEVDSADASNLYNCIVKVFADANIDLKKNLIGYAADGAANMTGRNNSVASMLRNLCPHIVVLKCICHSFALCCSYACLKLPSSVESMARDIYNYVQNSPKRITQFEKIVVLLEEKPRKILHPSQTRWLFLESVVNRLLQLYEPLKIYFSFAVNIDNIDNAKIILDNLNNPINELYLKFLKFILPQINKLNKLFQSESPQIHKMYDSVRRLVHTILDNFIKPEYLKKTNIEDVNFKHPHNILNYDKLYLGVEVAMVLENQPTISVAEINIFKNNCIFFYIELCEQIYKRFDFKSNVLKYVTLLDPSKIIKKEINSLSNLFKTFPNLINECELQEIDDEFREIRNLDFQSLFTDLAEDINIEIFWKSVCGVKRADNKLAFPLMNTFVFNVLSLPNSSANVERIFSQINLNKTKCRNRLQTPSLKGIIYTKDYLRYNNSSCYNVTVTKDLINKYNSTDVYQ